MPALIIIALVGLSAQLIDGGLGMGYGVISSSLLLLAGLNAAAASASVHLAEIGTTLVSGASHWKFGNIDWSIVTRIALPGAVGAFIGAYALSSLPADVAKPWTSGILFILGAYLLIRFSRGHAPVDPTKPKPRSKLLIPLGLVAGTVDATGGGGWGPIATPTLLASKRLDPKKIIGSVSASEFAVAIAATAGFGFGSAIDGVVWPTVTALLIGGIIAAPIAAWLVRRLPTRILGVAVGGVIIATNANTVLTALGAPTPVFIAAFTALTLAWAAALTIAIRTRPTPATEPEKIPALESSWLCPVSCCAPTRRRLAALSVLRHPIPGCRSTFALPCIHLEAARDGRGQSRELLATPPPHHARPRQHDMAGGGRL